MKRLVELSSAEARKHFLKASSYFNGDLPSYLSFEPILTAVDAALNGATYAAVQAASPSDFPGVNYSFVANKDGRLAWRPYELIHPVIYVSLVDVICQPENWKLITDRLSEFTKGVVDCCSAPVMSLDRQKDVAAQVRGWWQCHGRWSSGWTAGHGMLTAEMRAQFGVARAKVCARPVHSTGRPSWRARMGVMDGGGSGLEAAFDGGRPPLR